MNDDEIGILARAICARKKMEDDIGSPKNWPAFQRRIRLEVADEVANQLALEVIARNWPEVIDDNWPREESELTIEQLIELAKEAAAVATECQLQYWKQKCNHFNGRTPVPPFPDKGPR